MPVDWMIVLRIAAAIASAMADLPANYDHRSIAKAIANLINQLTHPPKQGGTDNAQGEKPAILAGG
jgi:hypothetical protein